jgi:ribosome recycling factor
MLNELLEKVRPEMDKTLEFLGQELSKLRTGQASPVLVENVEVDIVGQKMPLKQLAGISSPQRRQLLIQPWDQSYLQPIEKALQKTELGASPIVEQNTIRISLPPLTQEYRDQLIKIIAEKSENARQALRKQREDVWNDIQGKVKKRELTEDDKFKGKSELQKMIDEYNKKIEERLEKKKTELQGD